MYVIATLGWQKGNLHDGTERRVMEPQQQKQSRGLGVKPMLISGDEHLDIADLILQE